MKDASDLHATKKFERTQVKAIFQATSIQAMTQ